jgi:hypothetical protein
MHFLILPPDDMRQTQAEHWLIHSRAKVGADTRKKAQDRCALRKMRTNSVIYGQRPIGLE